MKIRTHQFGEINFENEHIVKFSFGLFGFEQLKNYLLIKTDEELFYWLNSVDEPEISFPLIGTRVINTSFPEEENHEAFGIVTLNQDPLKVTVNPVSYTHLRAHETVLDLVCRLLLEKKKQIQNNHCINLYYISYLNYYT